MSENIIRTSRDLDGVSKWTLIPEPILLNILKWLPHRDILCAGQSCKRWYNIMLDDFLWRKIFQRDFQLSSEIRLRPGAESWQSEYKRLTHNTPMVLTELMDAHAHQVLHVSFSNNGKMFATCSKDGFLLVWNSSYPCSIKYKHDMKQFNWKYTQYSKFNESDTLILVSGVNLGSAQRSSGEIAVFSVTGRKSHLRCRVVNRPYDIFGTWFGDQYLISGKLHWLGQFVSTSVLWLNKSNQAVNSEHVPIMNQLYKFYNTNASTIRNIMIANCPWLDEHDATCGIKRAEGPDRCDAIDITIESSSSGNPMSNPNRFTQVPRNATNADSDTHDLLNLKPSYSRAIQYSPNFWNMYETNYDETTEVDHPSTANRNHDDTDDEADDDDDDDDDAEDEDEDKFEVEEDLDKLGSKYLIFSTGTQTYAPHQIGFKLMQNVFFPKRLDPGLPLKDRIAKQRERQRQRRTQMQNNRVDADAQNVDAISARFDEIDYIIEMHGHIIGTALSPDHKYLFVNCRAWPKDYCITNALEPPPIAQEIDIHVIDLKTLERVGIMRRVHKVYSSNVDCFFQFIDVCDKYVASGAEDMHAYLWDRYYGACLAKYQHGDVVNCVAFNRQNSQIMVTASDDYTIKVWRSVQQTKELQATEIKRAVEFRLKD